MKISIGFSALIVSMMLLIAMVMPATACVPCEQTNASIADDFNIETEEGLERLGSLLHIALDEDARTVIADLQDKGYKLQYNQANIQKVSPIEDAQDEAIIAVIPAKSEDSEKIGQVIFAFSSERTVVGNAIIEFGEDYGKMEIFEINDGVKKNYVVENNAGVMSIDGKPIITDLETRSSSTDCDICLTVCGYVYTAGCGLTGYATCTLGCACFTGPAAVACPPICAVVFALICFYGSDNSCPYLCADYC
jgi:hypothetical protein